MSTVWAGHAVAPCYSCTSMYGWLLKERSHAVQRYWGVLDILVIDCEATVANRQLAQQYGVTGFPTFMLLHEGRRLDQVRRVRTLTRCCSVVDIKGVHGAVQNAATWNLSHMSEREGASLTLQEQGVDVDKGELPSDPHVLPCSSQERGLSRPWRSTLSGT